MQSCHYLEGKLAWVLLPSLHNYMEYSITYFQKGPTLAPIQLSEKKTCIFSLYFLHGGPDRLMLYKPRTFFPTD